MILGQICRKGLPWGILLTPYFATLWASPDPSRLWDEARIFYKTPQSAFPSGQLSKSVLLRDLRHSEESTGLKALWSNKMWNLKDTDILRPWDCYFEVRVMTDSSLRSSPSLAETPGVQAAQSSMWQVLKSDKDWLLLFNGQRGGWIKANLVQRIPQDHGVFVLLMDSFLRKKPEQGSSIISTAFQGSRWRSDRLVGSFLEVQHQGLKAYLDLAHLAHVSDFALQAKHRREGWMRILGRTHGFLLSEKQESFPLQEFEEFQIDPQRALMKRSLGNQGPAIRSRISLVPGPKFLWNQSWIENHGLVWWKSEEDFTLPGQTQTSLTRQEIFRKQLFSFSESSSKKALASQRGVYKTLDGDRWEKLEQFHDQTLPVLIHPSGPWYVGSFRSTDGGDSFEPFLRWDKITEQVQRSLGRPPLYLRLIGLEAPSSPRHVDVIFSTGLGELKLRGDLKGISWERVFSSQKVSKNEGLHL